MLVWQDNSSDRRVAAGSASNLYAILASGVVTDITPVDLVSGDVSALVGTGYGNGFYGTSFYGTSRPDTGNYGEATTWSLDTWGQNLVACSTKDGRLFEWDLNALNKAAAVSGAPTGNLGLMVTEERFLFALGAGGNPRLVQWSDREDNTTWIPDATNEAGDIELQTPGQIMAGIKTRGQALILTDTDAHTATYVGPPFVYGFERVGTACGLASRKAIAATDRGVFWMGHRAFFVYDGSQVQEIPCAVHDRVFGDLNAAQITKSWAMPIGQSGEVWWFYASSASNEIDRYVAYDYKEGHWMIGEMSRTSGADRGVFRHPIMSDVAGNVFDHEAGWNYDGLDVFAETGPISIGVGDNVAVVTGMYPDEKSQGQVRATFKTRFYPNDVEREYGPFTMSAPTSFRFTGRQIRMRVTGSELADWRVGVNRLETKQGGKR
jgi:hypothetical protein